MTDDDRDAYYHELLRRHAHDRRTYKHIRAKHAGCGVRRRGVRGRTGRGRWLL